MLSLLSLTLTNRVLSQDIILLKPEFLTAWILEDIVIKEKEQNLLTKVYHNNY